MTPTADPPAPRPRRRWWRRALSLRSLMILVLLIGGGLGWWTRHVRLRRAAIATIEAASGNIFYIDQIPQGGSDREVGGWRTWLYERTGVQEFREPFYIGIDSTLPPLPSEPAPALAGPSFDAIVEALGMLGPIGHLRLGKCPLTATGVRRLADLPIDTLAWDDANALSADLVDALPRFRRIRQLEVSAGEADLPRSIFEAVGGLTQLKSLRLTQSRAADLARADLARLGRLRNLEGLDLPWATFGADGLGEIDPLDRLRNLDLGCIQPDDETLRRLVTHHPHLQTLSLDGSALTDEGIQALAGLAGLSTLDLTTVHGRAGRLTDASLATLGRLPTLGKLNLPPGRYTALGLDALRGLPLQGLGLRSIGPGSEAAIGRLVAGRTFAWLTLSGPGVTDAVLPLLAGRFMNWATLDLSGSAVTDAGMPALASLPMLRLRLDATALTDAGLATLAAGAGGGELVARGTKITRAGIAAYEAMRPGTNRFEGSPDDD